MKLTKRGERVAIALGVYLMFAFMVAGSTIDTFTGSTGELLARLALLFLPGVAGLWALNEMTK